MAGIGLRYGVFAEIESHTDGSPITYKRGERMGPLASAVLNLQMADDRDYGDDIVQDTDQGIRGLTLDVEMNSLPAAIRAKLLGWKKESAGDLYNVTDATPPEVGTGWIRVVRNSGITKYEVWFIRRLQFGVQNETASTKKQQVEWNHHNLTGTGMAVYIDNSGEASYLAYGEFDTEAAAKAALNGMVGITA